MTKYTKVVLVAGLCGAFAVGGVLAATSVGASATSLHDAASLSQNNTFTGVVNQFPSIKIGSQGVGGVTFFNGTIINLTTDEDGQENPVTFGDDVRIDGKIMRGPWYNEQPVWVADDMQVDGNLKQGRMDNGVMKAAVTSDNSGTVTQSTDNTADESLGVSVEHAGVGIYTVEFESDVSERYIQITPRGSSTAPTAASGVVSSNGTIVTVYIADVQSAGALVDQAFTLTVF